MSNIIAVWSCSLHCDCPKCEEFVDLLDYRDFWDERDLDPIENNTKRCKDVKVVCPECNHKFIVDLEY